ncbi:hypothetical protein FA95DRAFT_1492243, partial [Auriscalpium vulgare]
VGFVDMLNQIRYGNVTSEIVQRFKQLSRRVHYEDGIGPTELYPTRMEVDNANNTQLDRIEEDTMRYDAYDRPGIDSKGRVTSKKKTVDLLDRLPCQRQITLKVFTMRSCLNHVSSTDPKLRTTGWCTSHAN